MHPDAPNGHGERWFSCRLDGTAGREGNQDQQEKSQESLAHDISSFEEDLIII
jgi:hypothetical protein